MKKICLSVIGIYLLFIQAFGQTKKDSVKQEQTQEPPVYIDKPLQFEEINLVSSYYNQNGDHSAIQGGIGNEKVTDLSNGLEVKFVASDADGYKYTLTGGLGVDHHTAASSAWVSVTGSSKTGGTRVYPSLHYTEESPTGKTISFGATYSDEYNYHSLGLEAGYGFKVKKGGEFDTKLNVYLDKVRLIYPSELSPYPVVVSSASNGGSSIPSSPRYTFSGSANYLQIINQRLQAGFFVDIAAQAGYLQLPFHRVYFNNGSVHVEDLPAFRFKIPAGIRLNYFVNDRVIIRSYYRYYMDNWGIVAHTANIEIPVKINPFFSIAPFYRYYTQTASQYFAPYKAHTSKDSYYTSNYSYSAFNSSFYGVGIHTAPPNGLWKTTLSSLDVRYGHYDQTTGLNSNVISFVFVWK